MMVVPLGRLMCMQASCSHSVLVLAGMSCAHSSILVFSLISTGVYFMTRRTE